MWVSSKRDSKLVYIDMHDDVSLSQLSKRWLHDSIHKYASANTCMIDMHCHPLYL